MTNDDSQFSDPAGPTRKLPKRFIISKVAVGGLVGVLTWMALLGGSGWNGRYSSNLRFLFDLYEPYNNSDWQWFLVVCVALSSLAWAIVATMFFLFVRFKPTSAIGNGDWRSRLAFSLPTSIIYGSVHYFIATKIDCSPSIPVMIAFAATFISAYSSFDKKS